MAGVSRSVTITVAYLMARRSMSLNDAFSLVRSRKSNVGPNFHFMEQLHAFERELTKSNEAGAAAVASASTTSSPHSALSATISSSSKVGSTQSSIESADGCSGCSGCSSSSSGVGGVGGMGGGGGGGGGYGDESGMSSASSSADRKCQLCGTPQPSDACAKCPPNAAAQFLSPNAVFGLSPDSGIEFDRWTPGLGE